MAGWEGLRVDLRRLRDETPDALVVWQDPGVVRPGKRVHLQLAAWATEIAAELNAKYGDLLELSVGAMSFPAGELLVRRQWSWLPREPAETADLDVAPMSPLMVRTGRDASRKVLVTNRAARMQALRTNGELSSAVVDGSGRVVGQYVGPHPLSLVGFEIEPRQARAVPVWIGTASVVPELGFAVPPGQWGLVVWLATESGSYLSPPLELTITP